MDFQSNMYYYSMCHTCKDISKDLKVCGACKSIWYCCKEHQVEDWPNHRKLCKIIKKSRFYRAVNCGLSWDEWIMLRTRIRSLWEKNLKRSLVLYENQIWMFPRVCAICYSSDCKLLCDFCLNAAYCTTEHQQEHISHKDFCKSLRICMEIDHYLFTNNYRPTVKFLGIDESIEQLPRDISELMKFVNLDLDPSISNEIVHFTRSADFIAPIATFLYVLERISYLNSRICEKDRINLHIIGAGVLENYLDWVVYLEFICHWILNLKYLKVTLIGPESIDLPNIDDITADFCEKCNSKGIEAHLEFHRDFYHNICDQLASPDFMLLYNNGLHEFQETNDDTWLKTIPCLMNSKAYLILTSYTLNEMMKDLNRLQSFGNGTILMRPQKNPYMCCRPYRDWETHDEPVFYENAWLCVIAK